ncbi:MAG: radical SAM family heme chaperone HemW [Actinobacteria bacterium]|nr:radical SAM family heme chaperone HemW [Actinomycetota bacterium]
MSGGSVRHLYVHLPFCATRCGYCDFVTLVGRTGEHGAYVDALLRELALERDALADPLDTIFLGGGTPTFTEPAALERVLASLPAAAEVTIEANPETVHEGLTPVLARNGVNRVSIGAQTFNTALLDVLDRRARPEDVRRAVHVLRDAGFENISLDLIYGIPGQTAPDLERDLEQALELAPDHLSCYELEAKPGTRFTHAHGEELGRQADAMEGYFELVVETLVDAGYRWYETANFCRPGRESRHNLAYWLGRDYVGIGIGAVSTVGARRWRNAPKLRPYVDALASGRTPPREDEPLDPATKARERLMLALRLDEPVPLQAVGSAIDPAGLARAERLGLAERRGGGLALTRRGRFLGGAVTAEILA